MGCGGDRDGEAKARGEGDLQMGRHCEGNMGKERRDDAPLYHHQWVVGNEADGGASRAGC